MKGTAEEGRYYAFNKQRGVPGDIGFDPLNLGGDDAAVRRFELAELKHARLAMIGLGGLVHQEILTKQATFEQLANFQPLSN